MRSLFASLLGASLLAGCAVAPYDYGYGGSYYYDSPAYYGYYDYGPTYYYGRAITVASRWAPRPSLAAFSIAPADVIGMAAAGDAAVPSPVATREVRPSPARTRAAAAMQA